MSMKLFVALLYPIAIALSLVGTANAEQCLDGDTSLPERFDNHDHVFLVKIVGAQAIEDSRAKEEYLELEFRLSETFKGNPQGISLTADSGLHSDQSHFAAVFVGAYYLVFAHASTSTVHISMCGPSTRVAYEDGEVSPQIKDLRRLSYAVSVLGADGS